MSNDSIQIQHFHAQYTISGSSTDAVAIQRHCDRIAQNLLTRVWEDWLAESEDTSEALYFIEQMEVDLALDVANLDDLAVAKSWARALDRGIRRALSQGNQVTIFRNRSELIASFLDALLRGHAWEEWYFRQEFAPLRLLPLGQIAVQVLTADGDVGRDALIELTRRNDLELLLGNLGDADVATIVSQCLLPPSPRVVLPNTYPVWVQSLRYFLAAARLNPRDTTARNLTRVYLTLLRHRPELGSDVNLARFIHDLLELRQVLQGMPDRHRFLALVESDEAAVLFAQLGRGNEQQWLSVLRRLGLTPEQPWVIALRQIGRGSLQQLAALLREVNGSDVVTLIGDLGVAASQPATSRLFTPYGGIFLLVGAIAELELYDFLQNCPYPEPPGIAKAGLLLWLVALQCLGRVNAGQARRDGGLALFAGLSQPPGSELLQQYGTVLTPEMHPAFGEAFQSHYREISSRPSLFRYQGVTATASPEAFQWFSLSSEPEPLLGDSQWDGALATVSSAVLEGFAAKLGAFADSSPAYISRNFLESQAAIEVFSDKIVVRFLTCPLQMILHMAGFDSNSWEVPWLENRQLTFEFE